MKRDSKSVARNFKLRIMHVSDTHSLFQRLMGNFDVVLHTGDMFPNSEYMTINRNLEVNFQLKWLRDNIPNIKSWLQGRTFLYVPGNHDFMPDDLLETELRAEGVNAINLTNKLITFQGVNFYGFPYVPSINGNYNYEKDIPEMQVEVDKMIKVLNSTYVDVLACHSPPYKILDLTKGNTSIGSSVIDTALIYKINNDMFPAFYLCGHCHDANGITIRNGIVYVNSATTQNIIQV